MTIPYRICFSCSKNCKSKFLPDEKAILLSSCTDFCYGELKFNWSLYEYDDVDQVEPFYLSNLKVIPKVEFQNMTMNPIDELNIAIKPNSLKVGRKYTIAFRAIRPNGVYGELRTTVIVNSPPIGGKV